MTPVYISHSFRQTQAYERALALIEAQGSPIRNMTIPIWRQLPGTDAEIAAGIRERVRQASRVVVLVTDDIRESKWVNFEIACATEYNKPLIALRQHGEAKDPLPSSMHEGLYKVVGWRGAALVKAIQGEYAPDSKVYRVAEHEERKALVARIAAGTGAFSILVLATADSWLPLVQRALVPLGVAIVRSNDNSLAAATLKGAAIGGLAALLIGVALDMDGDDLALLALGGAGVGGLIGAVRQFRFTTAARGPFIEAQFEEVP